MIKKELFKNKRMKAVAAAAALSASISLCGCTSAVQTNAEIETTSSIQTVEEIPSSSVAEIDEVKEVQDTVAPTITVSNPRIEVIEGADIHLMDGVRASDDKDGDLTAKVTASDYDANAFDIEQTVTYKVADEAGNEANATAILLIKSNPIETLDKDMYTTSSVNVRSDSGQDSEKLGSLSYGQSVHVTGKDKNTGWYQIDYSGSEGYVSNSYLSDSKPAPSTSPNKGTTNKGTSGGSSSDSSSSGSSSSGGESSSQTSAPAPSQPSNSGGSWDNPGKLTDPNGGFPKAGTTSEDLIGRPDHVTQ